MTLEELGVIAQYFMLRWNLNSAEYYAEIEPEKIDDDIADAPEFSSEQRTNFERMLEAMASQLATVGLKVSVEEINYRIDGFLVVNPWLSECIYFGTVVSAQMFEILVQGGRALPAYAVKANEFRSEARAALSADTAARIDETVLPLFQANETNYPRA